MVIKDFKPGQTVYELTEKRGRTCEHSIKRHRVVSVGRKYVKAIPFGIENDNCAAKYYLKDETDQYLTENKDWGDAAKLFLTEEAANDHIEEEMTRLWLRREFSHKIDECTFGQLRAVKRILEGTNELDGQTTIDR